MNRLGRYRPINGKINVDLIKSKDEPQRNNENDDELTKMRERERERERERGYHRQCHFEQMLCVCVYR